MKIYALYTTGILAFVVSMNLFWLLTTWYIEDVFAAACSVTFIVSMIAVFVIDPDRKEPEHGRK